MSRKTKKRKTWPRTLPPMSREEIEDEARKSRERQALRAATFSSRKQKQKQAQHQQKPSTLPAIPNFYDTPAWKILRYKALKRSNGHCQCCGAGPEHGALLNVDHIKPRRKYPKLALSIDNLQVLCASCNQGKGSWDKTDWRPRDVNPIDRILDLKFLSGLRERGLR